MSDEIIQNNSQKYDDNGEHNSLIKLSDTRLVLAYTGADGDGFIRTGDINANGTITEKNTIEHDTTYAQFNSLIKLSDTRIVLAYKGPDNDSFIKTFDIDANGTITQKKLLEHDTDSWGENSLIKLSDTRVVLAYRGPNNDGFIKTFDIATDGTITQNNSLEHDIANGGDNSLIKLSDTRVVLAYRGDDDDGFIKTFDIATDGTITQNNSLEHDIAYGGDNSLIKLSDTRVVLAYTGINSAGFVKSFDIDAHCTSNICFVADTIVETDQGKIEIDKIVPGVNTIKNKQITHLTKTFLSDDKMVLIKKNSLGKNIPNRNTTVSGFHKIIYNGVIYEAYKLARFFKDVKLIRYENQPLYNIMMDDWEFIKVHNMTVETLHPDNVIAKLYRTKLPENQKQELIRELSQATIDEDYEKYELIKNHIL